ncbi:MAG: hypothetical protein ACFB4J_19390 [Elainellaceae cyanobacterium]
MGQPDRLSLTDLTQRILEMSETGIYRESIFEVFHSLTTKKDVRRAIAYAKTLGLYSVASLRDDTLGTFYQLDPEVYQQRKHAVGDIALWEAKQKRDAEAKLHTVPTINKAASSEVAQARMAQDLLSVVRRVTGLLLLLSLLFGVSGQSYLAGVGFYGALGAAATWQLQRLLIRRWL